MTPEEIERLEHRTIPALRAVVEQAQAELDAAIALLEESSEPIVLVCPECGADHISSADTVLATAQGDWIMYRSGRVEFAGAGESDVHWDSQEETANPCYCNACYWQGTPDLLVEPTPEEES